ncbi:MAG: DUF6252 family protein [Flavisolibacter sp.]
MLTLKQFLLIVTSLLLLTSSCRKNKSKEPVDQLPPETQTGANTFGCLVDGQVFKPKGDPLAGPLIKAQSWFINGKNGFSISARRSEGNQSKVVGIAGDSIIVRIGIFDLTSLNPGKMRGGYSYMDLNMVRPNLYETNDINRGELKITKVDNVNQIFSGTFWFDASDSYTGIVVKVREGRFDLPFAQ